MKQEETKNTNPNMKTKESWNEPKLEVLSMDETFGGKATYPTEDSPNNRGPNS